MDCMKEVIEQIVGSVSDVDAASKFQEDNKVLIEAFKKIGIPLRDENGDYRNTYEVLKDMSEKYEQLYGQDSI